ncbi:MAG: FtsX-like permease family protein [Phycisphaerae bacterium]|nr:FtsX-like permease family protein [Phycisphaerae bacterium]
MYKLFLCLRYLRSRIIAYFAVLGVALCVAMMLIVVSVMNGFLDRVEKAAKGLFGDIVVEASSAHGMGLYDEFVAELRGKVAAVQAASPFIVNTCFIQVPGNSEWSQVVQAAGIRLPERAAVTDFAQGLHYQQGQPAPSFDPDVGLLLARQEELVKSLEAMANPLRADESPSAEALVLRDRLDNAILSHLWSRSILRTAGGRQQDIRDLQARLDAAYAASHGEPTEQTDQLDRRLEELVEKANFQPPPYHVILGLGIGGLSFRTPEGQTIRLLMPGQRLAVSLIPLGRLSAAANLSLTTKVFTVVDDCRTDVASIDSEIIYLPFETLQRMSGMEAKVDPEDPNKIAIPARCNQIHIKAAPDVAANERRLAAVCGQVQAAWNDFRARYGERIGADASVMTWRQRQASLVGPIEKQRTLTVIMFGIISLVSVVLIFVIFYMIVFQKTKDIGVLKAVGASSSGVAGIFLAYGAAVGLVGSILGTIGGYYFVRHINAIQDAVDQWFGFRVWERDVFMFEKIPNEVQLVPALLIVAGAIVAGLLGAIIPALRAARMQPVEALRYE